MNNRNRGPGEVLPPHNVEAEQGVLGCCMLDVAVAMPKCVERFGGDAVFFDERHQRIFEVIRGLWTEHVAVDVITVQARLKSLPVGGHSNWLEACGGIGYLAGLQEVTPSALHVESYIPIVWEKFLARKAVQLGTKTVRQVMERDGLSEGDLARIEREIEEFRSLTARAAGMTPQDLKRPSEFDEMYFKLWFKDRSITQGWDLPFNFVWKVRPHEMTVMTGDSGSGKSSFLAWLGVWLMNQGVKVGMASLEVPSAVTLWIMARQLLAKGPHLEENEGNRRPLVNALAWLNARLWLYDFVGITNWRTLLDVFEFATVKEGVQVWILDSVMRVGIPEDDMATQALAAAAFSNFTVTTGAHLVCVNHVNKGSGAVKNRVAGSKKWTDNANNLVEIQRNEDKADKMEDLREKIRVEEATEYGEYDLPGSGPDRKQIEEWKRQVEELKPKWDSKFTLHKQRWAGSPQNGSKQLWFDFQSLQFRDKYGKPVAPVLGWSNE